MKLHTHKKRMRRIREGPLGKSMLWVGLDFSRWPRGKIQAPARPGFSQRGTRIHLDIFCVHPVQGPGRCANNILEPSKNGKTFQKRQEVFPKMASVEKSRFRSGFSQTSTWVNPCGSTPGLSQGIDLCVLRVRWTTTTSLRMHHAIHDHVNPRDRECCCFCRGELAQIDCVPVD